MSFPIFFAFYLTFTLGYSFLVLPPIIDGLMPIYGVSYGGMSVLVSALIWSHALIQIPGGMLADRLGLKPALFLSLACLNLGNLLLAVRPDLGLAVAARFLAGLGTGMSFITTMKLVALHAPRRRVGEFQGYYGGFFSVGSILAYLIVPHFFTWGWRWAVLGAAAFSLPALAAVPFLRLRPDHEEESQAYPLRSVASNRLAWVIGIYHALSYGSMINLGNWLPSFLTESAGSATTMTLAWGGALVMLVSGSARLSGGLVQRWFSPAVIANGSILVLALAYGSLLFASGLPAVLSLSIFAAWFSSHTFGTFFQIAGQGTRVNSMATVFGFVNLLANAGAVGFTLMFGWLKDLSGTFSWSFGLLAALCLFGLAFGAPTLVRWQRQGP